MTPSFQSLNLATMGVYSMRYEDARATIKSGDLIAQSHRASMFSSWYDFKIGIVRMMCKSEYSHVAIAWTVADRVFVLEAVSGGVRIFPMSRIGEFYLMPLNLFFDEETEIYALAQVGAPYSQWEAIKAFFGPVDGKNNAWECAEYVHLVLKFAGVDLGQVATPTAVVRAAQLQGAICTLICNP